MQTIVKAKVKSKSGKGVNRKLRSSGFIPGVLYGPFQQATSLFMNSHEIEKILSSGGGSRILAMEIESAEEPVSCQVMFKDVQRNPVTSKLLHIDFYAIKKGQKIVKSVPVVLEGEAIGVKEQGCVLQFLTRNVKVKCLPKDLPEEINVDITSLDKGASIAIGDLETKEEILFLDDPDKVIASVVTIRLTQEEELPEEEEAEEEVEEGTEASESPVETE